MFHVGQLVVCVDDARDPGEPPPYIERGRVYTVSSAYDDWYWEAGKKVRAPFVTLFELPVINTPGWTRGFEAACFRPIDDTKLAIFRKMLAPAPRKEKVA